mmetsp:Transcript_35921/g.60770  ORF Transcript_35921/g.60770 Transcript_35921/m.60770 type:complete len:204 (+) Transcript_35921:298-909(+)
MLVLEGLCILLREIVEHGPGNRLQSGRVFTHPHPRNAILLHLCWVHGSLFLGHIHPPVLACLLILLHGDVGRLELISLPIRGAAVLHPNLDVVYFQGKGRSEMVEDLGHRLCRVWQAKSNRLWRRLHHPYNILSGKNAGRLWVELIPRGLPALKMANELLVIFPALRKALEDHGDEEIHHHQRNEDHEGDGVYGSPFVAAVAV